MTDRTGCCVAKRLIDKILRGACAVVDSAGDQQAAVAFNSEAQKLAAGVLSLYNAGQGFFSALYPNGTYVTPALVYSQ